ncbi:MAG TPA: hypothetical protein VMD91_08630 [Candidatus Sulfotelmatobacter sp.]|nr:hypothetical protein [Candidatus Sulfotelmatobacter sp.]
MKNASSWRTRPWQLIVWAAIVVASDAYAWFKFRQPVELWHATIPVDLLLISIAPRLAHDVHRLRVLVTRKAVENVVLACVLGLGAFTAFGFANRAGLVPLVSPRGAAISWAVGSVLCCAGFARRAARVQRALFVLLAASQTAFAAALLFSLRQPDAGMWMVGLTVACVVIGTASLRRGQVRPAQHERAFVRRRPAVNE